MDKYSTVQGTASEITLGNGKPDNKKHINEYDDFLCSSLKNSEANGLQEVDMANNVNSKDFEVNSLLCGGCTAGFKRVLEMLDTVGSSITNLNASQGFGSESTAKTELAILSFEVANTIVKGSNLMRSLSKENIKYLKEIVLPSEGIQRLVSTEMNALLRIAAADKREDLRVFTDEVVRFGNRCKDPQWHNLNRYFAKLQFNFSPQKHLKEITPGVMRNLMSLVHKTSKLYHELHALDKFEQDYKRKLREEALSVPAQRGDNLQIIKKELKRHYKHVEKLKKKSLWSEALEEIMSKLVDIVHFLHLEIHDIFGVADGEKPVDNSNQRLGSAGLALHYANIVNQIDIIVSRSNSVPPHMRNALYQGLPPNIKSALRSRLQSLENKGETYSHQTANQVKVDMDKILSWLVPLATNTARAYQGFGGIGQWAKTGTESQRRAAGQFDVIKIGTLYHAGKERTEAYILDLVLWLHLLISQSRPGNGGSRSPVKSPVHSPQQGKLTSTFSVDGASSSSSILTKEDEEMLLGVYSRKSTPGISKSQEIDNGKHSISKHGRLSKSNSQSPKNENTKAFKLEKRQPVNHIVDFDIDRMNS